MQLIFPAGALTSSQTITITPVANPPAHPQLVAGTVSEFDPSGTFQQPVTVKLSYAGTTVLDLRSDQLVQPDLSSYRQSATAGRPVPITFKGSDGKQYVAVYSGIGGDWALLAGDLRSDDPKDVRDPADYVRELGRHTSQGGMVWAVPTQAW